MAESKFDQTEANETGPSVWTQRISDRLNNTWNPLIYRPDLRPDLRAVGRKFRGENRSGSVERGI